MIHRTEGKGFEKQTQFNWTCSQWWPVSILNWATAKLHLHREYLGPSYHHLSPRPVTDLSGSLLWSYSPFWGTRNLCLGKTHDVTKRHKETDSNYSVLSSVLWRGSAQGTSRQHARHHLTAVWKQLSLPEEVTLSIKPTQEWKGKVGALSEREKAWHFSGKHQQFD